MLKMKRSCNENGAAMKVPLPTCFATLRKGVHGNNANDGNDKMGIVLGRKNCSPDSIQNFEHHISPELFRRLEQGERGHALQSLRNMCITAIFSILPMLPEGGTYHSRYSVYLTYQSSSQFPACWGILGPPVGRLIMILSTLRTETAASVAKRIAHALAAKESTMLFSVALTVPSVSAWGNKQKKTKSASAKG